MQDPVLTENKVNTKTTFSIVGTCRLEKLHAVWYALYQKSGFKWAFSVLHENLMSCHHYYIITNPIAFI